jgi:integrase
VQKLQCQVQSHHQGWKFVAITVGTRSTLRIFLAALKMFYQVMRERGTYGFANPLVDSMSVTIVAVQAHLDREEDQQTPPHMPEQSGVEAPRTRPRHRLTDSYYKLEHEEWLPQIIDDLKLPGLILEGGQHLPLKYTRQRDEVVTWLLFDTGARVSEVTGLMLGDWAALGTHTKARAFNKGSYGRRTKTLSFYDDTVILLKRYFDEERIRFDPNGYRLEDYLLLSKYKHVDLQTIPLFLTTQGTPLAPKEYREHYWNPACQAAGIEADVHQSRHWHVTREVRDIYETAKSKEEIEQRLRGLVEYMKWKSEETLAAYQLMKVN